ncbi:hypothetical protein IP91_02784 [Pseudoduganella lurida]|uniref:DUF4124 domain-containing protein n=1 Tax=Pseudoduganella lurida TaxID=1036180 RepID=A0A562RAF8_9BURK|nr:DUF4124 domain-containing protein [Pseudoduganella lurida]TWI65376.1 hypothetical protein IP91_02784 [Pseudoduganella lurida]
MRRSALFITLSLALAGGSGAFANDQIYKCLDPNGATLLSDKPCAVIESVEADAAPAAGSTDVAALPTGVEAAPVIAESPRHVVAKEHYTLPPAEVNRDKWANRQPATAAPRIDVATLKAAKLKLEMSDRTASLD